MANTASPRSRHLDRLFESLGRDRARLIAWRARCAVISASSGAEIARGWRGSVRMTASRVRKQHAGNFVHSFIAHRAVNQKNSAAGEILFPEFQQFARAGGIVRAVEIDGGLFRRAARGAQAIARLRCRARSLRP